MEKEDIIASSIIEVPRGKLGKPIQVDLKSIVEAERRIEDIATVTTMKAPELLYTFNKAWKDLHEVVTRVKTEKTIAEIEMARVKGELILDHVPQVLKDKGLWRASSPAGSEDLRQAVLDTTPAYLEIQEKVNQINGAYEFLKGKLDSFRMAYESVKKILGEASNGMNNQRSPYLGSNIEENITEPPRIPGVGRPRY